MDEVEAKKLLWKWTVQHVNHQIPFFKYLPVEQEVTKMCLDMNINRITADRFRMLLRMFIADEKYCRLCEESGFKSPCYLDGKRKTVVAIDGELSFAERDCRKRPVDKEEARKLWEQLV